MRPRKTVQELIIQNETTSIIIEMTEHKKVPSYTFSWSHLNVETRTLTWFSKEKSLLILRDLIGFARPGQVLAIMGTSGVGMY